VLATPSTRGNSAAGCEPSGLHGDRRLDVPCGERQGKRLQHRFAAFEAICLRFFSRLVCSALVVSTPSRGVRYCFERLLPRVSDVKEDWPGTLSTGVADEGIVI